MRTDLRVERDSAFTVPNMLTACRILMGAVAAVCFAAGAAVRLGVVLCVVAALLDAFDGWYARTFSQCSNLGKHLDPLDDKFLMAVVYGLIAFEVDRPAVWLLVVLIAVREAGMTAFRAYSLRRHRKFIPANRLGKVKMIVQSAVGLSLITFAYFVNGGFEMPVYAVAAPLLAILVLSYVSAAVYIRRWRAARVPAFARGAGPSTAYRGERRVAAGE